MYLGLKTFFHNKGNQVWISRKNDFLLLNDEKLRTEGTTYITASSRKLPAETKRSPFDSIESYKYLSFHSIVV